MNIGGREISDRVLIGAITISIMIPAFIAAPILFPPVELDEPIEPYLPHFILFALVDAFILGLGIAFIIVTYPRVRDARPTRKSRVTLMYFAIAYLLGSWWFHSNLHINQGFNLFALVLIDYGFHVPLMLAGTAVAYGFFTLLKEDQSVAVETGQGEDAQPSLA